MENYEARTVPLEKLLLDPNNYRFTGETNLPQVPEKKFQDTTVQKKINQRLVNDGISELRKSIITNGFLPVERIVVKPFEHNDSEDLYVVLEGNRRVATLREIKNQADSGIPVPEKLLQSLSNLPVILLNSEDPSAYLTIMGVRHVGGIKEWGGYQSAKLVFELRTEHKLSTPDVASKLGLSAIEVNRRYRAFRGIEEMRNNEEYGDHVTTELYPLFHEALSTTKVKNWLQWNDEEGRAENENHRDVFYSLISPHEDEQQKMRSAKIDKYSQVREMKTLLDDEDAYESLVDLNKSFSDAVALVKADQASREWVAKVKSTNKSLGHVGIIQIKNLSTVDKKLLTELRQLVDSIIETHDGTTSKTQ